MQKALGIVIGLTIPLVGAFSFAYADSLVAGYVPATSTDQTLAHLPTSFSPGYVVGESFTLYTDAVINSVSFDVSGTIGETMYANLFIYNGGIMQSVATSSSQNVYTGGHNVFNFTFTPYSAVAGTYVVALHSNYNAATQDIYGTRSNVYNDGCLTNSFRYGDTGTTCDTTYGAGGSDAYFAVYGAQNTASRIQAIISPAQQSYSTNAIVFSYTYYSGYPTVSTAGVQLQDLTLSQTINTTSIVSTTTSSGSQTYAKSLLLSSNHSYRWRAVLVTSAGNQYSGWRLFDTGQLAPVPGASSTLDYLSSFFQGSIIGEALNGDNFGTINDTNSGSSTQTGINAFQNVASYLSNRVPIGYIWDIRDIYQAAATSSTTFAALKYDFGNSNISSTTKTWLPSTITILSTSTVTYYLSGSTLDLFNALVTAMLWVSFLWVVFKRGKAALTPSS